MSTMHTIWAGLIMLFVTGVTAAAPVYGITQIPPEARIDADEQTILEITSTFDHAEEAIRARDLEAIMALYSDRYRHHGLGKSDIRQIWEELFSQYDLISNIHIFSAITTSEQGEESRAQIGCTGALWATSRNTKQRIPIDSWHDEVHHLVKENGAWRIIGSDEGPRRPRMFGTAPHPLF